MKRKDLKELYQLMFSEYPDLVNVVQLQSMLGIGRHLAYELINNGSIKALKIGHTFKIPKANVIEYIMGKNLDD